MTAPAILKINFDAYDSVAIASRPVHTKSGSETKTDVPQTEVPSIFTSQKSNMAARTIFTFDIMAQTR